MKEVTCDDVHKFLQEYISGLFKLKGISFDGDLPDDYDMILSGAIDSVGLLDLILEVQNRFGVELEFDELDPEEMTVVGPLCRYIYSAI